MPHVNPTLPADDTGADVADYNTPILAILAVFNGHIDGDNIEPGSLPWSVMDTFTGEIPAAAMEDDGNVKKFRDEANINFVASGLLWSDVSGLNGAMSSGVLYSADGSRTAVSAVASRAFTASKDTYVDIAPNGTLDYSRVVNNGVTPGAIASGYTCLAKVVTDGTEITSVTTVGKDPLGNLIRPTSFKGEGATAASDGATVATSQTTTSTSYADLSTVGPSVTVDVPASGKVLVLLTASMSNSGAANATVMSFVASGANTLAGSDVRARTHREGAGGDSTRNTSAIYLEDLTPGSTTFKAVYRVSGGTGTISGRDIAVIPLG